MLTTLKYPSLLNVSVLSKNHAMKVYKTFYRLYLDSLANRKDERKSVLLIQKASEEMKNKFDFTPSELMKAQEEVLISRKLNTF